MRIGVKPRPVMAALCLAFVTTGAMSASDALGPERARLLLVRAGFAPSEAEVRQIAGLTQTAAVDRMIRSVNATAATAPPGWIDAAVIPQRVLRTMSDEERRAEIAKQIRMGLELRAWWLREMAATSSPLTERMTLFWHNHFVSAQPKVRHAQLMYRQNVLLRQHALGRFDVLLHAVAKDPAMLVYLDSASNRAGAPNENFAREVMELFTLGQGGYGERDIKEAARAFTGWSIDIEAGTYLFRPRLHDDGEKTVLGRTGRFDGDAVLDILLAQPSTAQFIVGKLWREFVSPEPDPVRVAVIASQFRASGWRIDVAVATLLMQPEVVRRSEDNALVKSPVELVIGLARQSGSELQRPATAAVAVASMGQNLYSAPDVRGWPGGEAWINTQTLLARKQFVARAMAGPREVAADPMTQMTRGEATPLRRAMQLLEQGQAVQIDPAEWLAQADMRPERVATHEQRQRLAMQLLVVPPVAAMDEGSLGLDALRALLLDPAYQLK